MPCPGPVIHVYHFRKQFQPCLPSSKAASDAKITCQNGAGICVISLCCILFVLADTFTTVNSGNNKKNRASKSASGKHDLREASKGGRALDYQVANFQSAAKTALLKANPAAPKPAHSHATSQGARVALPLERDAAPAMFGNVAASPAKQQPAGAMAAGARRDHPAPGIGHPSPGKIAAKAAPGPAAEATAGNGLVTAGLLYVTAAGKASLEAKAAAAADAKAEEEAAAAQAAAESQAALEEKAKAAAKAEAEAEAAEAKAAAEDKAAAKANADLLAMATAPAAAATSTML